LRAPHARASELPQAGADAACVPRSTTSYSAILSAAAAAAAGCTMGLQKSQGRLRSCFRCRCTCCSYFSYFSSSFCLHGPAGCPDVCGTEVCEAEARQVTEGAVAERARVSNG